MGQQGHTPSIAQTLAQRAAQTGWWATNRGVHLYERHRLCSLALSPHVAVASTQLGGIKWLDLDTVEQRYLLTAAADSTVEAFDILAADERGGHAAVALQPLFSINRSHPAAHRYQVTGLVWYPVDTGLFVTGSADQDVKVWDANMLQVACTFRCPDKVLSVAMSGCATSHALIAVGSKKPGLVLADVVSGAFTHTLDGHSNGTWSVCWSAANEHQLFSGDGTGAVRLWDIRRSGCRAQLDVDATPQPRSAPGAAAGGNSGSSSSAAASRKRRQEPQQQRGQRPHKAGPGAAAPGSGGGSVAGRGCALAHEGVVTAIHATQDDRSLVTAGADHRVRLWDTGRLCHQLVHYSDTFNKGLFPKRLSSTPDGRALFVPRGSDIQVLDLHSGRQLALLSQGHYEAVTACAYSPSTGRLWSCGLDGAVLAWEPRLQDPPDATPDAGHAMDWWLAAAAGGRGSSRHAPAAGAAAGGAPGAAGGGRPPLPDVDFWSDDEDTLVGRR